MKQNSKTLFQKSVMALVAAVAIFCFTFASMKLGLDETKAGLIALIIFNIAGSVFGLYGFLNLLVMLITGQLRNLESQHSGQQVLLEGNSRPGLHILATFLEPLKEPGGLIKILVLLGVMASINLMTYVLASSLSTTSPLISTDTATSQFRLVLGYFLLITIKDYLLVPLIAGWSTARYILVGISQSKVDYIGEYGIISVVKMSIKIFLVGLIYTLPVYFIAAVTILVALIIDPMFLQFSMFVRFSPYGVLGLIGLLYMAFCLLFALIIYSIYIIIPAQLLLVRTGSFGKAFHIKQARKFLYTEVGYRLYSKFAAAMLVIFMTFLLGSILLSLAGLQVLLLFMFPISVYIGFVALPYVLGVIQREIDSSEI